MTNDTIQVEQRSSPKPVGKTGLPGGKVIILVVGAHPDDVELGLGATIHRFRKKHQFHGLVLTSGALRAQPAEREQAALRAAEILGYTPYFMRFEDGGLSDMQAEQAIQRKLSELKPDLVIGHSSQESHRDHRIAHTSTLSASRRTPAVLFFEGPYTRGFVPKLFVAVDEIDLKAKTRALREHAKVLEPRRYLDDRTVEALARTRGASVNVDYAEAFVVERLVCSAVEGVSSAGFQSR